MTRAIAWFARNPVAANLLMWVAIVAGLTALPRTPQKIMPDADLKMVQVQVPYLGAAPEEAEQAVCIRIEEALDGVEGVERIRSTANEGICAVNVELFDDADESVALDDVKNRIDAIDTFPEEAEKPIVSLLTPKRSVMDIAISGPSEERALKVIAQRVRDEIAALPGITQVELLNTRPYEVSIEVSEESLRRHGLSFSQVATAVRRGSLDRPGGAIKTEGGEILLRTKGQAYSGLEFERLVVWTRSDGTRIHLSDVATVIDGFEDTDQAVEFNGRPAAMVRVFRVGDQSLLDITDELHRYLADPRLPQGVELTIWEDGSQMLRGRLDILIASARQGFLLVLLLLAFFLRPRISFWVSVGVPVSFLGAFWLASSLGVSINQVSAFGFIVVLGILVDDAIVIGENVHTHQQAGEDLLESSITGAQEVAVPVIFGVFTTVAAFTPLLLVPGPMGQMIGVIAIVVMCCLLFSLIESQLVLPAHLGHRRTRTSASEVTLMLLPILALLLFELAWDLRSYFGLAALVGVALYVAHRHGELQQLADALLARQARFSSRLERFTRTRFHELLGFVLEWRYTTAAVALAVLFASLGTAASGRLLFSFAPPVDSDRVSAKLTMPLGTPARVTQAAVAQLEAAAEALRDEFRAQGADGGGPVTHILAAVGGHPVSGVLGTPLDAGKTRVGGGHLGEVTMHLLPPEERELTTRELTQLFRERVGSVPEAVELQFVSALFTAGEAINIELRARNVDDLRAAAARARGKLAEYPGVLDISDSFRSGKMELKLNLLPAGEALGLTLDDLARQVRQAFYGEEAQRIQRGRDDVRVMVRYTEAERRSLGSLDSMRIRTADGSEVPFATVARADLGRGYSTIQRSDRQRVVNVTADINPTITSGNQVLASMGQDGALEEIVRDYPGMSIGFEGQQRQQSKTMAAVIPMFGIALFLIYALLAIPLHSYTQPLIIMSVIPFALVGSIWGHLLMGALGQVDVFSFMSAMGFIAASGVVVNSSLVLVHYVNGRRAAGLPLSLAVREASIARFRPIVLTSLTTFAGLTPLMLNQSIQAAFLVPMAVSLAFGVVFAAFITLLVLPGGYMILEDLGRRLQSEPTALEEPVASPRRVA